LRPLFKKH